MQKRLWTGSGFLIALALFLGVNVLSNAALTSARLDLTEHKLYTLSPGVRSILEKLEEPITLRFYFSQKLAPLLPGISSYTTRVKELLEEFAQAAGDKIALQIIDPEPFSEEEDRAVGYGLRGVPVGEGDTLFYLGLVGTSSTDDESAIPFFQPDREEFLEYDLAKLVHALAHPKQRVVGLLTTLPLDGGPGSPFLQGRGKGEPWIILDQIRQSFQVKTLSTDVTKIPDEVDVLMVVHPKNLKEGTLYAIDQFVLKGGRALIFVDPHSEADQPGMAAFNPMGGGGQRNSDLPALFDAWGLELVRGKVVGDLPYARRVQYRDQSRIKVATYPVWIDLPPTQFNPEDIITAQLPNLTLATAGILKKKEDGKTEFLSLVETDDQAMQIDSTRVQFSADVSSLLREYKPEGETFALAARISGKVRSAFPNGIATEASAKGETPAQKDSPSIHIPESSEPINVIVVADTDFLQDHFWVQVQSFLGQRVGIPTAGNGTFVINALDNLSGSNDLITVRTRGGFKRPFTLVQAIQQDAEQQFRQKEQELLNRKRATERKIQELQAQKQDQSALILSPEQEQEIERFRQELVLIRKDLRGVQHELRKNIERLEDWLKFLNIGLMPLMIGVVGLLVSVKKVRRKPKLLTHRNQT